MTSAVRRSLAPITVVTMLTVVAVDLLTKQWAVSRLSGGRTIDVIWTLRFNLHFNTGIAFSQLTGYGIVVGVAAIGVAVGLLFWSARQPSQFVRFAIGLIVGGAFGNVIDRLFRDEGWMRGAVVDFIDFQWFPIFNAADMGVTVGASLLVLGAFVVGK